MRACSAAGMAPWGRSAAPGRAGHSINYALYLVCGGGPLLFSYAAYSHSGPHSSVASSQSIGTGRRSQRRAVETVQPPLAGFFGKRLAAGSGIVVRAHADVSNEALCEAGRLVRKVLRNLPAGVVENMRSAGAEVRVLGEKQRTSDMPDLAHHRGKVWEKKSGKTIDERARGLAGISCLCAEENLLKLPSDRHKDHRAICVHEFAHVVHRHGLDERGKRLVTAAFKRAQGSGLWQGCYAMTNEAEFFAELSMWYFGSHGDLGKIEPRPQPGPGWLEEYDPSSYKFFDRLYSGQLQVRAEPHVRLQPRPLPPPTAAVEARTAAAVAKNLAARHDGKPCSIVFDNQTAERFTLSWVDYKGELRRMGAVHPAEKKGMRSYGGHSFVLSVDEKGPGAATAATAGRKSDTNSKHNDEVTVVKVARAAFTARQEHGHATIQSVPTRLLEYNL